MFVNETYGFVEGEGMRLIGVKISNEIARNLTVLIFGGIESNFVGERVFHKLIASVAESESQTAVENNGPLINTELTFISGGARMLTFPVTIGDDMVGLENIESYSASITALSPMGNVDIGTPVTLEIMDNDGIAAIREKKFLCD